MYKTVISLPVFCLGPFEKGLNAVFVQLAVFEWEVPERLKTLNNDFLIFC
jgi:hypothetical protein